MRLQLDVVSACEDGFHVRHMRQLDCTFHPAGYLR